MKRLARLSLRLRLTLLFAVLTAAAWGVASVIAWQQTSKKLDKLFDTQQLLFARRLSAMHFDELRAPPASLGEKKKVRHGHIDDDALAFAIFTRDGKMVLNDGENGEDIQWHSQREGFSDGYLRGDDDEWRFLWLTTADGRHRIAVGQEWDYRREMAMDIVTSQLTPWMVALPLMFVLLIVLLSRELAPLKHLARTLRLRAPDSAESLSVEKIPPEVRPLVEALNQLFQRTHDVMLRERRFTSDAAHELRSPLTAIKTHLQVARMTEGAAAEQALAHAEEGADRLHRTLDQLLLLARVEGSLSFDDGVQCSAEDAARVAMHDAGHGDVRMFELKLADGLSEAPLEVPSVLAIAALRNLLDNALRHTAAGTRVELAVETAQGCARFHVRDHGPGIAETDLPHLTRRFWRHGKSGGSGLGLAIVQAIVQRCQCRLDFDSRADGLRVTLEMPLRK